MARAIAGGADFLVTRDSDLVKRAQSITPDVYVLQPHALIQLLDRRRRQSAYTPAQLEGTDLELKKLESPEIETLLDPMILQSAGERGRDLRKQLQSLLARPTEVSVWSLLDSGVPIACFAEGLEKHQIVIPLFRVRRSSVAHTLARHLLFRIKLLALTQNKKRVEFLDPLASSPVVDALRDESFSEFARGWEYHPVRFVGALATFRRRIRRESIVLPTWLETQSKGVSIRLRGIEVERHYWPAKITDADLDTFVIPIKPAYAEALFDLELAEQSLFFRARHLGLSREHVYYRNPRGSAGLDAPARIIWYVAAGGKARGTMQVVACSRLEEVAVAPPELLYQRFRHLGIYRLNDVLAASSKGEVMALGFTDTELFPRRVDLKTLRALAAKRGHGVFLQGPWRITPRLFEDIYKLGTR